MSYDIHDLVRMATVTDTEKHARFQYSVLDVEFEDVEADEAFQALSEKEREQFFEILSENYSEDSRDADL